MLFRPGLSGTSHTHRPKPFVGVQLRFLTACLAVAALGTMFSVAHAEPAKQGRRNVLLYVVDDQGTNDAGCYGNPVIRTPGLDMLAAEGTRFNYAFCTSSSCSASRSVILSGQYNHANGQYGHEHSVHHFRSFDHVKSLPALLSEAGYRTRCAGKYHVGPTEVYPFDDFLRRGSPVEMAESCRDMIAAEGEQPFFLYFCTTEPHRPFRREGSASIDPADVIVPPYLPDTPECREELAKYYGSVERADSGLKRLIEILKETGRWSDTLVLYISDNGIAFPGAKTTCYEPGLHLPCVVRNPYAEKRGLVSSAMVNWADIAPTILDFAGAMPKKPPFHGRSFLGILEDEHPEGWDEVYASHTFHEITMYYPMRVVRGRKWKLIYNIAYPLPYPFASDLYASTTWQGVLKRGDTIYGKRAVEAYLQRPQFELYNLEDDPHEVRNLAADPQYTAVLEELKGKVKAFQQRTKDPWLVKWEYE